MYIFFENKTKSIEVYNSVEYIMRQNYINIHVQLLAYTGTVAGKWCVRCKKVLLSYISSFIKKKIKINL